MLLLSHVSKVFDYRPVLEDIDLTLQPGLEYALTAPNGTGKTTLLEIMAGVSRPTAGKVLWDGKPFQALTRMKIGAVFQQPMLYGDLTAIENLEFFARLYNCRDHKRVAGEWLERVNLTYAAKERFRAFSKGMKQRLALARAMLHRPELLLLDEPFDGLDVASTEVVKDLLVELQQSGTTLFKVTHDVQDAEAADIHLSLKYGRVVMA